jgi:hypothetical protein
MAAIARYRQSSFFSPVVVADKGYRYRSYW